MFLLLKFLELDGTIEKVGGNRWEKVFSVELLIKVSVFIANSNVVIHIQLNELETWLSTVKFGSIFPGTLSVVVCWL